LSISLPQVTPPVAAYVPFVRSGKQLFLSGHIAKKDGQPWRGQLDTNITTEQSKAAARGIAIDLIGTLPAAAGDLDKVARIVKLMVLVNSSSTYTEQHIVANGASELFKEVFGERGAHARSVFPDGRSLLHAYRDSPRHQGTIKCPHECRTSSRRLRS
jgi:enamine deaminase RidA (YjgF/YER057c/UK114 family)